MTDPAYPPLRPQPPLRPRRRPRTSWPVIIGVVVLAILTTAVAVILLGGDEDGPGAASPTAAGSGSAGATPSSPASAGASDASAQPTEAAQSGSPGGTLEPDTIVATVVEALSVRAEPGRDAERLGTLELGAPSFVAEGPVRADGHDWYLVSGLGLPPNSGCATPVETEPFSCPIWFGWVASASETGEPWLEPADADCPAMPPSAEALIVGRTDLQRLACFHADPVTFRAWWPEIPEDAGLGGACAAQDEPSGWLLCQNINHQQVTINEAEGFGGLGLAVSIDPASGLEMPERGTWVELRVHLDDPAAQGCDEAAQAFEEPDREQAQYVLDCRAEMVVESAAAVDGPGSPDRSAE